MKIRGHIDYGNGAGPAAQAAARAAKAASLKKPEPKPEPRAPYKIFPKWTDDQILEWLKGYCVRGERAPSPATIRIEKGERVNGQIRRLCRAGLLVVEYYGHNWRVFTIGDLKSAPPPAGWKCFSRQDTNGLMVVGADGKWRPSVMSNLRVPRLQGG